MGLLESNRRVDTGPERKWAETDLKHADFGRKEAAGKGKCRSSNQ